MSQCSLARPTLAGALVPESESMWGRGTMWGRRRASVEGFRLRSYVLAFTHCHHIGVMSGLDGRMRSESESLTFGDGQS